MPRPWPRLSTESLGNFRGFGMRKHRFLSPRTGRPLDAFILECPEWVNVVALTAAEEVVLIRQFRFGTEQLTLEIPGGLIDPGEDSAAAAARELREETGYAAERWTSLGSIAPNPAIQSNRCHTYLAEGCRRLHEQELDQGEDIDVELHPLAAVPELLAGGAIDHSLVAVAFQKLELHRRGLSFS